LRYLELEVLTWRGGNESSGNSSDDSENGENGKGRFATVVMLQEMSEEAFEYLLKDDWVRRMFAIVPRDPKKWPENATYGNMTLVSRDLEVINAYILHFTMSQQARTGIAVNLRVAVPGTREKKVVCLVNTHLESLPEGEPLRPEQLGVLTKFLKQRGIEGGIIAGDMNAINPKVDKRSVSDVGLKDAWRKSEKDPEGYTWGIQKYPDEGVFPPNRLDKVLYLPRRSYKVDSPERIGIGLKIESRVHGSIWASDHFGLLSAIHVIS
jgi:tyrosyl-DNA phosphodiesterase 2